MRKTRALTVVALAAASTSLAIASSDKQAVLAPIDTISATVEPTDTPASPPAASTRCPRPHYDATTIFTSASAPISSALSATSQSPTSQLAEAATEGELNDKGAAGLVAKASLFPLVVGLAAAVVML